MNLLKIIFMIMRVTKENLIKERDAANQGARGLLDLDKHLRKEFGKLFFRSQKSPYPGFDDIDTDPPSWERIFAEVGSLLAARSSYDMTHDIRICRKDIDELNKALREMVQPTTQNNSVNKI